MKNHFAVMGNPISHSLSPHIHQCFAKQFALSIHYERLQIENEDFESAVHHFFNKEGKGLNITLPYKERAFALATQATQRAEIAKASNTLWMENGQLWADNTDGVGLLSDLKYHIDVTNKTVLILGAGGAARGIIPPLLDAEIANLTLANRTQQKAEILAQDFPDITLFPVSSLKSPFDLIINATSASLGSENLELSSCLLKSSTLCYDLAYNIQKPTPFVEWANSNKVLGLDGLGMLVEQAAESFFIWLNKRPETRPVLQYLRSEEFLNTRG